MGTRIITKAGLFIGAAALLFSSGCCWRTSQADHLFGPALYRLTDPPQGKAIVCQTRHFPLLLEGGRQWGISIGGIQRIALSPIVRGSGTSPANSAEQPSGWRIRPESGPWQWSWIYLRAPLKTPPVMISRTLVGAQASLGNEGRAVSLGYSSITLTTPRADALHELDFNSRSPHEAEFFLTPASELEGAPPNQQP